MERRIDTGTPVADHVIKLLDAAKITHAIIQACELQLFDEVQKSTGSTTTAAQLAKNKNWEPDALRRLMDTMVSVKLLSKTKQNNEEDTYQNTEGGRLLIKDGPPTLHEYALHVERKVKTISQLADTIKKGPLPEGTGGKGHHHHGHHTSEGAGGKEHADSSHDHFSPEFWVKIYKMCDGVGKLYADHLVTAIDLSKHKKTVDLGGGTGVFSYALLRAYPEMEVVLGELPKTLPVIEEQFISKNRDPRLSTMAVNYETDALPKADLYLIANCVHHHDGDKLKELFSKVHGVLNTGGSIMIVEQLMNDGHDGPPLAHAWDLQLIGKAGLFTGKELATLLDECNFGDIQIVKTQDDCMSNIIYACKK